MAHAENSTSIDQTPQVVYDFLVDGLNNSKWRDAVIEISLKAGLTGQPGAEYRQVLKGPGGRAIDGDYRLTAAESPSRIAFEVTAGPARPVGEYRLEAVGRGTKVTFTLDLRTTGLMKLMGPMIRRTMESEVSRLAQLKAVLEAKTSQ